MLPLPLTTDPSRTEFGAARTKCACPDCSVSCRHVPGYLLPSDLARLTPAGADDDAVVAWALENLLASPGAVLGHRNPDGTVLKVRVPTLVPARQADGSACHWLAADGRCAVHDAAPFGCAFFDAHKDPEAAGRLSLRGVQEVWRAWQEGGLYARAWRALEAAGRVAPSPEESRAHLAAAIGTPYPLTVPPPGGRVGRNDPCPCGSGRKFKVCCLRKGA